MTVDDLAQQVAEADPADLLPSRLSDESSRLPEHLTLIDAVRLPNGTAHLAVMGDPDGGLFAGALVPADAGHAVRRALPGDAAAHDVAASLRDRASFEPGGFTVTVLLDEGADHEPDLSADERPMLVDQTHESVVVGERVVVKWAVHAEPTPASLLVPHLAEAGFSQMPRPWGFVTWHDVSTPDVPPVLLASVMDYLPGATDGWTWAVQDVGDLATGGLADREAALAPIGVLGELVADLHLALATSTSVLPDPRTEADPQEVARWRDLALRLLAEAVEVVDGPEGDRLKMRRDQMVLAIESLSDVDTTSSIPVHGDLHIGQVLRWAGGYAVGDFDGNPVLPVRDRLHPQPAARDVAGMLQSIDHVGRVVVRRVEGADPGVVEAWICDAHARFLLAYRRRLAEHDASSLLDDRLLLPFRVEQECREFLYAVRHLPRWRYVPDQALQALFPVA